MFSIYESHLERVKQASYEDQTLQCVYSSKAQEYSSLHVVLSLVSRQTNVHIQISPVERKSKTDSPNVSSYNIRHYSP